MFGMYMTEKGDLLLEMLEINTQNGVENNCHELNQILYLAKKCLVSDLLRFKRLLR